MDKKLGNKLTEGVSVKEIEQFSKRYFIELFFTLLFFLATLFSWLFWGLPWSILLAGIGGIIGTWMPKKIGQLSQSVFRFLRGQQKATRITLAIVFLIFAVFIPPLIYLLIGLAAAQSFFFHARDGAPHVENGHLE